MTVNDAEFRGFSCLKKPSLKFHLGPTLIFDFEATTKVRARELLASTGPFCGHPSKDQPRST
ncbi:hypothetical protein J6590_093933, partial [Homalodisca vitripennis]